MIEKSISVAKNVEKQNIISSRVFFQKNEILAGNEDTSA